MCSAGSCVSTSSCSKQSECTGTLKCGGPSSCAGTPCFTCFAAGGTGASYAACTDSSGCASGLCDELRGHCSAACALATTGDTDCTASLGVGYACTEETISIGTTSAALGYCARKCNRNADCAGADVCQGSSNSSYNRVDITCGPVSPTDLAFGATCTTSGDCGSGVCLTVSGGAKRCSRFCLTGTDCGGTLPSCGSISFLLPKGGTQAAQVCVP